MRNNSRTYNAARNVSVSIVLQAITLIANFIGRTVFVKMLGNDYLSCDGLFANILTVLSFTELGLGSAIIFSMYKPVAENDFEKIGRLINLFSTAYRWIAIIITILGLCIVPILKFLLTDVPDIKESITLLYLLFLANTVSTYVFGYKKSLLIANQQNHIVTTVHHGLNIFKIAVQILLLCFTHSYIAYLSVGIVVTLLNNFFITGIANQKYKWIKKYEKSKLSKEEKKLIFSDIAAIFQYKIGSVILNGTDNIIISLVLKTSFVGLVSNYNMIFLAVQTLFNQAADALQPTIGNLNASEDIEKKYRVFQRLYFVSFWVVGFLSTAIITLSGDFVQDIWLSKEYIVSTDVIVALGASFFALLINTVPSMFRTTLGYFKEARMCPIYASVINIILSVVLARLIGLSGIFFATAIARFVTFNIIDPYLVYRKCFDKSVLDYLKTFVGYAVVTIIAFLLTSISVYLVPYSGVLGLALKLIACCVVFNGVFLLVFFKTRIFSDALNMILIIFKKRENK